MIAMLAVHLNFSYTSSWISSSENVLADCGLHFLFSRLFSLAPHLIQQSTSLHPPTIGIKRMLTSHVPQRSGSGTGWRAAHKRLTRQGSNLSWNSSGKTHNIAATGKEYFPRPVQVFSNGSLTSEQESPVSRLKALFNNDPQPYDAPLFSSPDSNPLLWKDLISCVQTDLNTLGLNTSLYAGHSFRRGGASSAYAAGLSDFEIQQLGQWQSDTFKLYIEPNRSRLLKISAQLHWAVPNATNPAPLDLLPAV